LERVKMRGFACGCVIVWLTCAAVRAQVPEAASPDAAQAELVSQVERWLSAGVEASVAPAHFVALGEPGTLALIAIFERDDAPRYVRLRALSMLGAMQDVRARAYLRALIRDQAAPDAQLHALHPARSSTALRRALSALAQHDGELPADEVAPCLAHRDPAVRQAAVRVLAGLNSPDAARALRARAEKEPSLPVKRAIQKALTDRSAPPAAPLRADPKTDSPPR
jgi:HEAT repeat protein